jgi:hypothetical protein
MKEQLFPQNKKELSQNLAGLYFANTKIPYILQTFIISL